MNFQEFIRDINGKKIAIIGLGVSNRPMIPMLCDAGAHVIACDKKTEEQLGDYADELKTLGVELRLGESYLDDLDGVDYIFRSPGFRPDLPQFLSAIEHGAVLTSEMESFFDFCPCPIFAVTGSDGKTTTTTLISEMLKAEGFTVHLGGNIGHPLLQEVPEIKETDFAVVELSSFQLMRFRKSPHVAVVTNVSPNHLNWHIDMQEYIDAKKNIFLYQNENDRLILNEDNDITRSLVPEAKGSVFMFSRRSEPNPGIFVRGDEIISNLSGEEEMVLKISSILLPGVHNIENYMTAIAATWGYVSFESIRNVAENFKGVEHRIQLIRIKDGVKYYNSSIDSTPSRTTACLNSFKQKCIVIVGGYDKHIPFDPLGKILVEKAKKVVLTGATAEAINKAILNTPGYDEKLLPLYHEPDFKKAVLLASSIAEEGDVVILSPGCASFDAFPNFEVRGNYFKEIVLAL